MLAKQKRKEPAVIFQGNKPRAVILEIKDYEALLEIVEDAYDRKTLEQIRRKGTKFRKLEDFLKEQYSNV
jgi:PHD/YefM family antitoxin component YafN of YafNO toxin-antitoxin module